MHATSRSGALRETRRTMEEFLVLIGAHWSDLLRLGLIGSRGRVVCAGYSDGQFLPRREERGENPRPCLEPESPAAERSCKKL
jgi:hypothetical protein